MPAVIDSLKKENHHDNDTKKRLIQFSKNSYSALAEGCFAADFSVAGIQFYQNLVVAVITTAHRLIISYLDILFSIAICNAALFHVSQLRITVLEMTGIEPVTSDLQSRRSTN
jgi:hypothetical protein